MIGPGRVWSTRGPAMLLAAALGLCLITAAEAAPSAPPVCMAVKGEGLSAAKSPVPMLLAAVVVGDLIVPEPLPLASLLPESISPRTASDLRGKLAPRAPPIRL